ncbi:MAG: gliding motility-associated C-terminal domain-containing protein [Flavobacteriales bacterium]|nr:gliding motility-associated C-terminal domain-containing protein [Flavobacteriales bacterium]
MSQSTGGTTTFDNLLPGDYTVIVSSGGCSYTQDFVIDGPPPLVFETSPDIEICLGGTATLEAFSADDDAQSWTFTWDNGAGIGSSVDVSPTETTTYSVFATDDFNCDASPLDVTVTVLPALSVEMTAPQLLCAGADALLEVTSSAGGNGGPYQYEWLFNGNPIGQGEDLTHSEGITGEYCVMITDGCETPAATDCQIVQIEQSIPVVFDADTTIGCFPAEINFENLVDTAIIDQTVWQFGDGNGSLENDPQHIYQNPGLYDVSLQVRSLLGCFYDVEYPNYINVLNNPQVNFSADPQPTTIPDTEISFFESAEAGVVSYEWVFGADTLGFSTDADPVFQFPPDIGGHYQVSLTVVDAQGCEATETKTIIINDLLNIYIPNSFTPNNDGINDLFKVEGTDLDPDRFTFQVFSRWGEVVFETNDINVGWNGSYQTVNDQYYAQDGIYSWRVVAYSKTTTERREIMGSVQLMR